MPLLCRILGHAYPPVFVQDIWGGLWIYKRVCGRNGCGYIHRISEVEFEREYLGR